MQFLIRRFSFGVVFRQVSLPLCFIKVDNQRLNREYDTGMTRNLCIVYYENSTKCSVVGTSTSQALHGTCYARAGIRRDRQTSYHVFTDLSPGFCYRSYRRPHRKPQARLALQRNDAAGHPHFRSDSCVITSRKSRTNR